MNLKNTVPSTELLHLIDTEWKKLTQVFEDINSKIPNRQMVRTELSFHDGVKLLGLLAFILKEDPAAIIEIGVWKGKSLALQQRLSQPRQLLIAIDPLELQGQKHDFKFFHETIFPMAIIVPEYSEIAINEVRRIGNPCKLLHIDGGHKKENVVLDFLNYGPLVKRGGFIVFDDYSDHEYSPEVKIAIDMMDAHGFFSDYETLGPIWGFDNSFVLRKN